LASKNLVLLLEIFESPVCRDAALMSEVKRWK